MASLTPATRKKRKAAPNCPAAISQTMSGTRSRRPIEMRLGIVTGRISLPGALLEFGAGQHQRNGTDLVLCQEQAAVTQNADIAMPVKVY
jgi:hypothetical protein